MDEKLKPGQKVRITLTEGDEYEGTVHFVNATNGRISLYNIKDLSTNHVFNSMYHYMRNEIRHLEIISDVTETKPVKKSPAAVDVVELVRKVTFDPEWDRADLTLKLPADEVTRLKRMQTDVQFITELDDRFWTAVYDLKNSETVAVEPKLQNFEHTVKICYVVIASLTAVYVFDLKSLGNRAFQNGLRFILQTEYITKVVHDGLKLAHVLAQNHRVTLHNIFDTQIADVIIRYRGGEKSPLVRRSLTDCLITYLDAPVGYNCEENVTTTDWNKRPLSEDLRLQIGERVALLISLRNQMQRVLDEDLYRLTDTFMTAVSDMDPGEAFYCLTRPHEKLTEQFDKLAVSR